MNHTKLCEFGSRLEVDELVIIDGIVEYEFWSSLEVDDDNTNSDLDLKLTTAAPTLLLEAIKNQLQIYCLLYQHLYAQSSTRIWVEQLVYDPTPPALKLAPWWCNHNAESSYTCRWDCRRRRENFGEQNEECENWAGEWGVGRLRWERPSRRTRKMLL